MTVAWTEGVTCGTAGIPGVTEVVPVADGATAISGEARRAVTGAMELTGAIMGMGHGRVRAAVRTGEAIRAGVAGVELLPDTVQVIDFLRSKKFNEIYLKFCLMIEGGGGGSWASGGGGGGDFGNGGGGGYQSGGYGGGGGGGGGGPMRSGFGGGNRVEPYSRDYQSILYF